MQFACGHNLWTFDWLNNWFNDSFGASSDYVAVVSTYQRSTAAHLFARYI